MAFKFDPDALLAALPSREVRKVTPQVPLRPRTPHAPPDRSMVLETGAYNGFTLRERSRTADVSNWLAKEGGTKRPTDCDVCGSPAVHEHAENYYDLTSWMGLCHRCHVTALHGRFTKPARWFAVLDANEIPAGHWARLISQEPFDLAGLLRQRGWREPMKADFASSS